MRFLLVCGYFAPYSLVAALRPTKLAKYLRLAGHQVFVIAKRQNEAVWPQDADLSKDLEIIGRENIYYMEPSRMETLAYPLQARMFQQGMPSDIRPAPGEKTRSLWHPKALAAKLSPVLHEILGYRCWGKHKKKLLSILETGNFDCIFSSYGPLFCHYVAGKLRKRQPGLRWIADFRDPVVSQWCFGYRLTRRHTGRYIRGVCARADLVTTVSEGLARYYREAGGAPDKVRVLRNGFDPAPPPDPAPHDTLRLLYAGTLYPGKSDLRPVLRALSELLATGEMAADKASFRYMGVSPELMERQLAEYPALRPLSTVEGQRPRADSLAAQRDTDLLLLASWNTRAEQGVMTGKAYEYLGTRKPILTTVTGDLPDSELSQVLLSAGQDCVWEEAHGARDFPALKQRLLGWYQDFLRLGYVPLLSSAERVAAYSYPRLAARLAALAEDIKA